MRQLTTRLPCGPGCLASWMPSTLSTSSAPRRSTSGVATPQPSYSLPRNHTSSRSVGGRMWWRNGPPARASPCTRIPTTSVLTRDCRNLTHLVFRFIGEGSNASIAALLAGECDIINASSAWSRPSWTAARVTSLQACSKAVISIEHFFWAYRLRHPARREYDDGYQLGVDRPGFFSDVRTRQAFAMCMDRQALVDTLLFGQSVVIDTYLSPQHPLYNPDVRHYEFDVAEGSALLEEMGWVDDDDDANTPRIAQGVANVPWWHPAGSRIRDDHFYIAPKNHGDDPGIPGWMRHQRRTFSSMAVQWVVRGWSWGAYFLAANSIWVRVWLVNRRRQRPVTFTFPHRVHQVLQVETWFSIQDGVERSLRHQRLGWSITIQDLPMKNTTCVL